MFLKSQLSWNVIIPAVNLDAEGQLLQKAILTRLLEDFSSKRISKDIGYFMAITTLDCIGEGKIRQDTGELIFPVDFSCITFKMCVGEVLEGVAHKILKHGVFLKCGPTDKLYCSSHKMSGYQYVPGENPIFTSEKSPKVEKGTVVRFVVLGEKYDEAERDFRVLVSMDGEYLGPIS